MKIGRMGVVLMKLSRVCDEVMDGCNRERLAREVEECGRSGKERRKSGFMEGMGGECRRQDQPWRDDSGSNTPKWRAQRSAFGSAAFLIAQVTPKCRAEA